MRLGSELAFQVDLAAAAIAVVALLFSLWTGRRQRRLERETLRLQRDSDVIAWSNACLANLCQTEMLMRPEYAAAVAENDFERQRYEVLAAISCSIDRGRMFFPNRDHDRVGLDKEGAFRGHRHAVLDRLVEIYELLAKVGYREPADPSERLYIREQSITHKRHFHFRGPVRGRPAPAHLVPGAARMTGAGGPGAIGKDPSGRSHAEADQGSVTLIGRSITPLLIISLLVAISWVPRIVVYGPLTGDTEIYWSLAPAGLWLLSFIVGLIIHGKRGLWILVGAPFALLLPALWLNLYVMCQLGFQWLGFTPCP